MNFEEFARRGISYDEFVEMQHIVNTYGHLDPYACESAGIPYGKYLTAKRLIEREAEE